MVTTNKYFSLDKAAVGGTKGRTQEKPPEEAEGEGRNKEQGSDAPTEQGVSEDTTPGPPPSCNVQPDQEKQQPGLLPSYS